MNSNDLRSLVALHSGIANNPSAPAAERAAAQETLEALKRLQGLLEGENEARPAPLEDTIAVRGRPAAIRGKVLSAAESKPVIEKIEEGELSEKKLRRLLGNEHDYVVLVQKNAHPRVVWRSEKAARRAANTLVAAGGAVDAALLGYHAEVLQALRVRQADDLFSSAMAEGVLAKGTDTKWDINWEAVGVGVGVVAVAAIAIGGGYYMWTTYGAGAPTPNPR